MTRRPRALVAMSPDTFDQLFDRPPMARLAALARRRRGPCGPTDLADPAGLAALADAEVLVTGWGCPPLTADVLAHAPKLRAVFHAAGTVKDHITRSLLAARDHRHHRGGRQRHPCRRVHAGRRAAGRQTVLRARRPLPDGAGQPGRRGATRCSAPPGSPRTVGLVGLSRIGRRVAAGLACPRPDRARLLTRTPPRPTPRPSACDWSAWTNCLPAAPSSACMRRSCPDPAPARPAPAGAAPRRCDRHQHRARCPHRHRRPHRRVRQPAVSRPYWTSPIPNRCPPTRRCTGCANVTLTPHIAGALGGRPAG